jgi:hypothetical protein
MEKLIVGLGFGLFIGYLIALPGIQTTKTLQEEAPQLNAYFLKECKTKYKILKDTNKLNGMTWQGFLKVCKTLGTDNMEIISDQQEKLVADEPLDSRIGRTKFDIGDVVCVNSHKDVKMTIHAIEPSCNTCKAYEYYTKWFDKNNQLHRDRYEEKTLTKCE